LAPRPVSIHAPARGATRYLSIFASLGDVSIHAPARGATAQILHGGLNLHVSIHAPARGATRHRSPASGLILRFNPRAREGRDVTRDEDFSGSEEFQSTRPRGARQRDRAEPAPVPAVSIHAPARGATLALLRQLQLI